MRGLLLSLGLTLVASASIGAEATTQEFAKEVERVLPVEKPYDFHRHLETSPVHMARRAPDATPAADELALPDSGWKLVWRPDGGEILRNAVLDFLDYLKVSMGVAVELEERTSLDGWQNLSRAIVVGTREQLPGCGEALKGPKDYRLSVTPERVTVCGFDARGAMFGLYNLEARMNLREAPFLKSDLDTVRHSLYDSRMAQSWMGWMEFPDALLSRMAHDGFDAIFASAQTNPNGDRTTAENSTDFYARILHKTRRQDPVRMHDLIRRASKYGIKVYTPIIYQYMGTPESEEGLRKLVRDIVREFPDIHGYVLLTEGFWYRKWGGQDAGKEYLKDWARNWCRAVGIVAEECHRVNPAIEILPWEYNINFRPENADVKRYFIQQLPEDTVPLLTWENGTGLDFDGFKGWVRDYSISVVGPAEVTKAQVDEAHRRKMRVYTNGDTFVCGAQLQTVPYQPFPYQWHARYRAMETHGVNGTMESWTQGYNPNIMTEFRGWYCWSDAPETDDLLGAIAAREFGAENREAVLKAWKCFSEAIRLVPDTGPYMGTGNAIGTPIFFKEPPARAMTKDHSWSYKPVGLFDDTINSYWPFTVARLTFVPDFKNKTNLAETYARSVSGVEGTKDRPFLPTFLKYLRLSADKMDEGLRLYRAAALASPSAKRKTALREVIVAEQLQRMLESDQAILEFEDLRLKWAAGRDAQGADALLGRMKSILREEIARTELSLLAATRDSRLGFQQETDYVYTPYVLREKLTCLRNALAEVEAEGGAVRSLECSRVAVDVSSLPEESRFVGDLLTERVYERTPESSEAGTLTVRYVLDAAVSGEDATVRVKGGTVEIRAGRRCGLIAGTGRLLKALRYGERTFRAADGTFDFRPAKPIRIAYLARHFLNWYMEATGDELCRYADDLALDGVNGYKFMYLFPTADLTHSTPEQRDFFQLGSKRLYDRIHELDCEIQFGSASNQVPQDSPEKFRGVPNSNPTRGNLGFNACPSVPGGMEFICDNQRKALDKLSGVRTDWFLSWPYDEGGCECASCRPWGGNGYLRMIERIHELYEARYPGTKSIISTWFFDDDDYKGLWNYLKTHDWVDAILCDDLGEFPRYPLEHKLPGRTKLITFPEISMFGRFPWGGYGATPLPKRFERLFRQVESVASGFMYYSEGLFEDFNQLIVTGLYVDPKADVDEVTRRYCSYYFPGADEGTFLELVRTMEANHPYPMRNLTAEGAEKAKSLALAIDPTILPRLRNGWRWRLFYLRAMIDAEMAKTKSASPKGAYPYFDELVKIYRAERQLQWVLDGNVGGWTCPAYEPPDAERLVYNPPGGEATAMLQKMFDDRMKKTVRLGPGNWIVGPLTVAQKGFRIELKDGCRLVGKKGAFKPDEGILNFIKGTTDNQVVGEGSAALVMPEDCRQPSIALKDGAERLTVTGVAR